MIIRTEFGVPVETLDVDARFTSTEVVYVLQENLLITGGAGGYLANADGQTEVRPSGRLKIDPGVIVNFKTQGLNLSMGQHNLWLRGMRQNQSFSQV